MQSLRDKIGCVDKQPVLFAGTVENNILQEKERATGEEILVTAKVLSAHNLLLFSMRGITPILGLAHHCYQVVRDIVWPLPMLSSQILKYWFWIRQLHYI